MTPTGGRAPRAPRAARIVEWIESVGRDVRYAARTLRRDVGFTLVAVISLAAGIGLNTVVFSIINTIFFQTIRGVPATDRVAFVSGRPSFAGYRMLRTESHTLAGLAAYDMISADVRAGDVAVRHGAPVVSNDYFAVLGVRPALGRFFGGDDGDHPVPDPVAVLDYVFWQQQLGGAPDVVGRVIAVNGTPLTVIGVAPLAFHGVGPERPPLWVPLGMLPALESRAPGWDDAAVRRWRLVGRLRDGVTLAQATAEVRVIAARAHALFPVDPLGVDDGRESFGAPSSPEKRVELLLVTVVPLTVMMIILWIGCSNVANLLLARAVVRRREIVVRLATGAPRGRVVRLLLTESLLLASLGGAAGLVSGAWAIRLVWATFPEFTTMAVELDGRVLVYTGLVALVSTVIFGLAPALQATRVDVASALTGGTGRSDAPHGSRLRAFFLVTQIASSVVLLVVASTFVRTLVSTYVGDQSALLDQVVAVQVAAGQQQNGRLDPARRPALWRHVREQLASVPGVRAVTLLSAGGDRRLSLVPEGAPRRPAGAPSAEATVQRVDTAFLRAMGYALMAGREAAPDDATAPGDAAEALLNERAARQFWPAGRVLGARFTLGDSEHVTVAGVVRDGATDPRVYRRLSDAALGEATVLVRVVGPAVAMVGPVRERLARLAPNATTLRASTLRDMAVGPLGRLTRAVALLGTLALGLAAVGLYGSIAFFTSRRTREIAVRMAVGAARLQVIRLLLGHGLRLVAVGIALGLALTAIAFRFMGGMIFGHWTLDLTALAAVVVVFLATTLAACVVPGRRAMRIDPMEVLRSE